jgi:hypothetical protein
MILLEGLVALTFLLAGADLVQLWWRRRGR